MKKLKGLISGFIALSFCVGISSCALDKFGASENKAREIVQRAVRISGGASCHKIKDLVFYCQKRRFKGERVDKLVSKEHFKLPNKAQREFYTKHGTVVQAFNGVSGFQRLDHKKIASLSMRDLRYLSNFKNRINVFLLKDILLRGTNFKYLGNIVKYGKIVDVIRVDYKGGECTLWFNKTTGLLFGIPADVMRGQRVVYNIEKIFVEYTDVGGIKFANKVVIYKNGKKDWQIDYDIRMNIGIKDDIFER